MPHQRRPPVIAGLGKLYHLEVQRELVDHEKKCDVPLAVHRDVHLRTVATDNLQPS